MRSLTTALHDKYISEEHNDIETENYVILVPKSRNRSTSGDSDTVTLPPRLTLEKEQITCIGDTDMLDRLCTHVKELDIGKNLISDWKQVFLLLKHMPGLHFLNIMGNPLDGASLDDVTDDVDRTFCNVEDLVLNKTAVSWSTLVKLLPKFTCLKELHLSLNGYRTVDVPPDRFVSETVVKLYMNDTEITEWEELCKLGHAFPSLESLTVMNLPVTKLSKKKKYSEFSDLISLNISGCGLGSWSEIDKIRRFPCLQRLRIADVLYFETIPKIERRQQMVARLPGLTMLNGTPITETEREAAERAFIRLFMNSDEKPEIYHELEKKHGKLAELAHVDLAPRTHINLEVRFEDRSEFMDIKLNQTVSELKKTLQHFSGLPPSMTNVYRESVFSGQLLDSSLMKLPNKTLISYNLQPEDRFLMERKDSTGPRIDNRKIHVKFC